MLDIREFSNWLETGPVTDFVVHHHLLADFTAYGHYLSFFLVVGINLIVDLRILGLSPKRQSASHLAQMLYPLMWAGLAVVFMTGFLSGAPFATLFYKSSYFLSKMTFAFLGIISTVWIRRKVREWETHPTMPAEAKIVAIASLLLWTFTIVLATYVPKQTCT